jgi:hypothetical protein
MVKAFKESHEQDVERLAADRRREAESKKAHALKNAPKHTVLCMKGLTSPVWTMGMFQMVTGDSCQCMKRTKQSTACDISVRCAACTALLAVISALKLLTAFAICYVSSELMQRSGRLQITSEPRQYNDNERRGAFSKYIRIQRSSRLESCHRRY